MKKLLILVLSADFPPYQKMMETQMNTWDTLTVDNTETVYYCGMSNKPNTDKVIYLPVEESLYTMGDKFLKALEWVLKNKEFDYIARPHSCIYVNKKNLSEYVQTLPDENVFAGLKVDATPVWNWGGCGFILSKDVAQKIVDNKKEWNHSVMEDMALSYLINKLEIPYTPLRAASIDNMGNNWRCMSYHGVESFEFSDFSEITKSDNHFFFRIKQDGKRYMEEFISNEMFKYLQ